MDTDFDSLINALSGCGVPSDAAQTLVSFQRVAEKTTGDEVNVDVSKLDTTSFDMSALLDACKEISTNQEVEEKVKKSNLFMKHILTAYEEVLDDKDNEEEQMSERFLKKLKRSKKRENSAKQNRRQSQSKNKGENYNERFNQKLMKKKRTMKAKGYMNIY